MHIALLAPLKFPIAEPFQGGLEMHTHLLARALTERGHTVVLFAHPDSDPAFTIEPFSVAEGAGVLASAGAYRRAMKAIAAGDFDVVHNNSIHFLPPLLAGTLACPMVTLLHTPPYRSHRLTAALANRFGTHRYVAISHFLGRQWASVIGNAYTVVHNGLDLAAWPFSDSPDPQTAVWYGRLAPEKGAEFAIAAARAAGYRLTLAGPVADSAYFNQHIAPALSAQITYVGHLNQAELAELVGRSAVGIVTSVWNEPFGLVYAEMLACGTPVAGFASGAAAEIVTPEVGALVPKYDVAALTQVLAEVERSKVRARCRQRVADAFLVDSMVEGYNY